MRIRLLLVILVLGLVQIPGTAVLGQDLPPSIISEGVPPLPPKLDIEIDSYRFYRSSLRLEDWLAGERKILVRSSAEDNTQIFLLEKPGDQLSPLTHHDEPVLWADSNPLRKCFVFASDNSGDENNSLFLFDIEKGITRRFANGSCKNHNSLWSHSGRMLAFSSDDRNRSDMDLYLINPPLFSSRRRIKEMSGWLTASSWSPDDRRLAALKPYPTARSVVSI